MLQAVTFGQHNSKIQSLQYNTVTTSPMLVTTVQISIPCLKLVKRSTNCTIHVYEVYFYQYFGKVSRIYSVVDRNNVGLDNVYPVIIKPNLMETNKRWIR